MTIRNVSVSEKKSDLLRRSAFGWHPPCVVVVVVPVVVSSNQRLTQVPTSPKKKKQLARSLAAVTPNHATNTKESRSCSDHISNGKAGKPMRAYSRLREEYREYPTESDVLALTIFGIIGVGFCLDVHRKLSEQGT